VFVDIRVFPVFALCNFIVLLDQCSPSLAHGRLKFHSVAQRSTIRIVMRIASSLLGYIRILISRPRPEGWSHHGRTFSIYLCPLSF